MSGRYHSVSSTRTYEECPQRYEYKYVRRMEHRGEVPMAWRYGTVVHAGLEAALRAFQAEGGALADHFGVANEAVARAWVEEQMPPRGGDRDRAMELVQEALARMEGQFGKDDVLGVEHKFLDSLPDGSRVVGFADLALRLGPTSLEVKDHKVTSNVRTPEELAADYQLNIYATLARQQWPWAESLYVSHHYPTLGKEVRVLVDEDLRLDAVSRFEAVVEMIEMDRDYEPRTGEWCMDCPFQDICPAWEESAQDADLMAMREF